MKKPRLCALIASFCLALWPSALPANAKAVTVGPFELTTSQHSYSSGWETGTNSRTRYNTYSLLYNGKPFAVEAPDGMFENEIVQYKSFTEAYVLPSSEPAILVLVGDPNNTSYYYLVHEQDKKPIAERLSRGREMDGIFWLDANAGQPAANPVERSGALRDGTLLLLNKDCVLNVHTLQRYTLADVKGVYFQFSRAISISPDQHVLVRAAKSTDGYVALLLVATDLATGQSQVLPIDAKRMRYADLQTMDNAWIQHHFNWLQNTDGSYTLAQRVDFKPFPFHGQLSGNGADDFRYHLPNAQRQIADMVAETMIQEFQAKLQVPDPKPWYKRTPPLGTYEINGQLFELNSFDDVAIYQVNAGSEDLIRKIGTRIDEQLATGKFDGLFKE